MNAPHILTPPHSEGAEQSVIGALLLDNRAHDRIADLLTEADFYRDDHRRIFRHACRLIEAGKPADVLTVAESLERTKEADQAGGLAYLAEMATATPSAANVRRYAEIVRDRAMLRRLQAICNDMLAAVATPGGQTPSELVARAEAELSRVTEGPHMGDGPITALQAMAHALENADARAGRPGILTGIRGFDDLTNGLEPGQLVILAARPGAGKSALALQVARNIARAGRHAAFFSLEMTAKELALRMIAADTGVSMQRIRAGRLNPDEWDAVCRPLSDDTAARIHIEERPAVSLAMVRAIGRRLHRSAPLSLIVVDYLQLMTPAPNVGDTRAAQVGSLSRGLKSLAKEIGVPILCLSQLNRATETRTDKRPLLSDLRDSGEIEQDADIVAMLHREELYRDNPGEWRGFAELLVRKHRQGPTGEVPLLFDPHRASFESYQGATPRESAPMMRRRGFD